MLISINGRRLKTPAETALFPEGLCRGLGVFETLKVVNGTPEFWEEHWRRLAAGSQALRLPAPSPALAQAWSAELLADSRHGGEAVLRLTWTCQGTEGVLAVEVRPFPYAREQWAQGFRLGVAAIRRNPSSPTTHHKTCSYLDNAMVREEAKGQGFDEAILLNPSGELCEGSCTNLFFVQAGMLHTPAPECGLLRGILRAKVLERAKALGIPCQEGRYPLERLRQADEIFVTNSLLHVMPVSWFEGLERNPQRPLTSRLAES